MIKKIHFYLIITCFLTFSVKIFSQAGSLDTSFNGDGIKMYQHGDLYHYIYDMITLPDTTTVVLASTVTGNATEGVLFRIKENSEVDVTFGDDDGYTTFNAGNNTYVQKLIQLNDGSFLAIGIVATASSNEKFLAARFSADGSLDTNYGSSGYFISNYSPEHENCYAVALQDDGKVVLAGRTLEGDHSQLLFMRVDQDGELDTSFGTNGYTMINASVQGEGIHSLGILSSGTIVGVGYGYQSNPWYWDKVFMAKLNPDGSPMTEFGTGGVMVPSVFTDISTAYCLAISNDSIFVTGYQYDINNNHEHFLTKLDSSGVADPAFGNNGIVLTYINAYNHGYDMFINSDGKIYNSGTTGGGGNNPRDFLMIRYLPDGSYDTDFDEDGIVSTAIRSSADEANSIEMQIDGKILLGGITMGAGGVDNKAAIARYNNDYVPFGAIFTSDTIICEGSSVQFTDQSGGIVTAWDWMFEGGTPPASTLQNPVITYNTEGIYDVQLIVTDNELNSDTLLMEDYIQVITTPGLANQPSGDTEICNGEDHEYTTSSVLYASEYEWEVNPTEAGTMSGTDTMAVFYTADNWSGDFDIKVRAVNDCGDGDWSDELSGTLYQSPAVFAIEGGGGYCLDGDGAEITLSGSETGVDYELYLNDTPTGNVVAGTGSEISFGFITEEGFYSAFAENTNCLQIMTNQVEVFILFPPLEPGTPSGPGTICLEETSDYTSTGINDADSYVWEISPEEAGVITSDGLEATVDWNGEYSGIALITLYGINECGDGNSSEELEVSVGEPNPQIAGEALVCDWSDEIYEVAENEGSIYTWEVTGGTINEGQGAYNVTISWEGEGNGMLLVNEETADGCEGSSELFEVVIDDCTGITEATDSEVKVHPNPASHYLMVESKMKMKGITAYNGVGKVVLIETPNSHTVRINTSDFSRGLYTIKIELDKRIIVKHIIIK